MKKLLVLAMLVGYSAACSKQGTPTAPTDPSTPAPGATLVLRVVVDAQPGAVAIAGVSVVSVDTTETQGDKLTRQIDFGDGTKSAKATDIHTFAMPGTYIVTFTTTDAAGRIASATQSVVVKSFVGEWFVTSLNDAVHHFEVRRVSIANQQGSALQGVYARLDERDKLLSGTVSPDRTFRLATADGLEQFSGTVPLQFTAHQTALSLQLQGGTASGQTLTFGAVPDGTPSDTPRARLGLGYHGQELPIRGLDVTFDASASTGDLVAYGVEYGDGTLTSEKVSSHGLDTAAPQVTARAIVVDRFGRTDVTLTEVHDFSFYGCYYDGFTSNYFNPIANRNETRLIRIERQSGKHVFGFYRHPEGFLSTFTGEMSGADMVIKLDDGTIEFRGPVTFNPSSGDPYGSYKPTVRGGSAEAQTLDFHYNYCS